MRRVNINQYLSVINAVLDSTQKSSAEMDPYFNIFRSALNDNEEIEAEDYEATQESFAKGVKQYQDNLEKLKKAQAPAQLIGVHKLLVSHYRDFVTGCEEMNASIDYTNHQVDRKKFDQAEEVQEKAMDKINTNVQKIIRGLRLG